MGPCGVPTVGGRDVGQILIGEGGARLCVSRNKLSEAAAWCDGR